MSNPKQNIINKSEERTLKRKRDKSEERRLKRKRDKSVERKLKGKRDKREEMSLKRKTGKTNVLFGRHSNENIDRSNSSIYQ